MRKVDVDSQEDLLNALVSEDSEKLQFDYSESEAESVEEPIS
jgi:hypothetical protein